MGRYESNQVLNIGVGKRTLKSNIYPAIPKTITDIYIISNSGDRLDLLANRYYGDQTLWWIIATANNLGATGLIVPPAKQLRIPTNIDSIIETYIKQQDER